METVEVSATGSGLAIVQVTHRYHVDVTGPDPSFFLSPRMDGLSNKRHIKVSACTGSVGGAGRGGGRGRVSGHLPVGRARRSGALQGKNDA